jgi:hypothetical protein
MQGFFLVAFPEELFPNNWLESSVPVFFDFRGVSPTDPPDVVREGLWCLLPGRAEGNAVVIAISRPTFVAEASSHPILLPAHEIVSNFAQQVRQQRANKEVAIEARQNYYQRQWMPRRRRARL